MKNLRRPSFDNDNRHAPSTARAYACGLALLVSLVWATKYAGDFEELGVSARSVGMGSAFVGIMADPSAMYYNPSASALAEKRAVMLMHAEDFGGLVKNDFGTFVLPGRGSSMGIGILHNGVSGIKLTMLPRPDLPIGTEYLDTVVAGNDTTFETRVNAPEESTRVSAADWVVYFNYARPVTPHFLVGGNAKLIYRSTGVATCFGMGLDLGATLVPVKGFNIGLRARNISTAPLFWDTKTRESVMPRVALGIGKEFALGKRDRVLVDVEAEANFEGLPIEENVGLEYQFRDALFGRIGFHRGNFTLGLGGQYKQFFVDYAYETAAYADSRDLPSTQKIAGGVRF